MVEQELSTFLGRKVDLETTNFLSPHFRAIVNRELVIAYEQT
jgi:predicted nucleotidyltransferase